MYRRSSGANRRRSSCLVARRVNEKPAEGVEESAARPAARSVTGAAAATAGGSGLSRLPRPSGAASHRKPLRGVSSAGPKRQTLGGGRFSNSAVTPQAPRRHLLSASTAGSKTLGRLSSADSARRLSRRSSLGSRRCGDLRPVADKEFQQLAACRVVTFLTTRELRGESFGAGRAVTPKELVKMSARLFDDIFCFIYGFLMPKFTLDDKRREDVVPLVLSTLMYPGQLSKSHLKTIGTPSSWPHLIAMLDWLCQTVDIATGSSYLKVLTCQPETDGFETAESRLLYSKLQFTHDGYTRWMVKDEMPDPTVAARQLEAALRAEEHGDGADQQLRRLEQLRHEHRELRDKSESVNNSLTAAECQLEDARRCRLDTETDIVKYRQHCETLLQRLADRQHELQQLSAQKQQRQQCEQAARERVGALKSRVGSQEMSSGDVERIARERADRRAEAERINQESAAMDENISKLELRISDYRAQLDASCRQLNAVITEQLLTAASISDSSEPLAQLRLRGTADNMLQDIQQLERQLQEMEREVRHQQNRLDTCIMQEEQLVRQSRDAADRIQLKRYQLDARLRRIDEEQNSRRDGTAARRQQQQAVLQQANDAIVAMHRQVRELDVDSLRASLEQDTAQYNDETKEKQDHLDARRQELVDMWTLTQEYKSKMELQFRETCRKVGVIKSECDGRLRRMHEKDQQDWTQEVGPELERQAMQYAEDQLKTAEDLADLTLD